jgi:hypothetical protein
VSAVGLREALTSGRPASRLPWVGLAVGSVVMLLTHSLGVVWLALILLTCLLSSVRPRELLGRAVRSVPPAVTLAVAGAGAAALAWTVALDPNDPAREHTASGVAVLPGAVVQPPLWFLQSFVTTSGNWVLASGWIYVVAAAVVGLLLLAGVSRATGRERAALVFLVTMWVAVPTVLTLATLDRMGFAWQGRYSLPLAFGVVVLTCQALDRSPGSGRGAPPAVAAGAMAVMTVGAQSFWLDGPPPAVLAATVAGFAAIGGAAWLLAGRDVARTDYSRRPFGQVSTLGPARDAARS